MPKGLEHEAPQRVVAVQRRQLPRADAVQTALAESLVAEALEYPDSGDGLLEERPSFASGVHEAQMVASLQAVEGVDASDHRLPCALSGWCLL